jgi:hypothetical protein
MMGDYKTMNASARFVPVVGDSVRHVPQIGHYVKAKHAEYLCAMSVIVIFTFTTYS